MGPDERVGSKHTRSWPSCTQDVGCEQKGRVDLGHWVSMGRWDRVPEGTRSELVAQEG